MLRPPPPLSCLPQRVQASLVRWRNRSRALQETGHKPPQPYIAGAQPAPSASDAQHADHAEQSKTFHDSAGSTEQAIIAVVRKGAASSAQSTAAATAATRADVHTDGVQAAVTSAPASDTAAAAEARRPSAAPPPLPADATPATARTAPAVSAPTPFVSPFQSPFALANRSGNSGVRLVLRSASEDAVQRLPPVYQRSQSGAYSDSFARTGSGSLRSLAGGQGAMTDSDTRRGTLQSDGATTGTTSVPEAAAQPQPPPQPPPQETEQVLSLLLRLFDAFAVLITLSNPMRTYIRCSPLSGCDQHAVVRVSISIPWSALVYAAAASVRLRVTQSLAERMPVESSLYCRSVASSAVLHCCLYSSSMLLPIAGMTGVSGRTRRHVQQRGRRRFTQRRR